MYETGLITKDRPVVDLAGADLRGADLLALDLRKANLRRADLRWATLEWADLREADLREANWVLADVRGADLRGAQLWDVTGMSNEELERQASSLEGAFMPDGQRYEAWLKTKDGRARKEENTGLRNGL